MKGFRHAAEYREFQESRELEATPATTSAVDAYRIAEDETLARRGGRLAQRQVEQAVTEAIRAAVADRPDVQVVVVNVNVQIADGGGATNQIGTVQSSPNSRTNWTRDPY